MFLLFLNMQKVSSTNFRKLPQEFTLLDVKNAFILVGFS